MGDRDARRNRAANARRPRKCPARAEGRAAEPRAKADKVRVAMIGEMVRVAMIGEMARIATKNAWIVIWPARSNGVVSLAAALAIWTTRTH